MDTQAAASTFEVSRLRVGLDTQGKLAVEGQPQSSACCGGEASSLPAAEHQQLLLKAESAALITDLRVVTAALCKQAQQADVAAAREDHAAVGQGPTSASSTMLLQAKGLYIH